MLKNALTQQNLTWSLVPRDALDPEFKKDVIDIYIIKKQEQTVDSVDNNNNNSSHRQ